MGRRAQLNFGDCAVYALDLAVSPCWQLAMTSPRRACPAIGCSDSRHKVNRRRGWRFTGVIAKSHWDRPVCHRFLTATLLVIAIEYAKLLFAFRAGGLYRTWFADGCSFRYGTQTCSCFGRLGLTASATTATCGCGSRRVGNVKSRRVHRLRTVLSPQAPKPAESPQRSRMK